MYVHMRVYVHLRLHLHTHKKHRHMHEHIPMDQFGGLTARRRNLIIDTKSKTYIETNIKFEIRKHIILETKPIEFEISTHNISLQIKFARFRSCLGSALRHSPRSRHLRSPGTPPVAATARSCNSLMGGKGKGRKGKTREVRTTTSGGAEIEPPWFELHLRTNHDGSSSI